MSAEELSPGVDSGVDHVTDKLGGLQTDEHPRTEEEYAISQLTLRAIVTSKEARQACGQVLARSCPACMIVY